MGKFEQDAHDTLMGIEAQQKRQTARYGPAPCAKPTGYLPPMSEQDRQEMKRYIEESNLPF